MLLMTISTEDMVWQHPCMAAKGGWVTPSFATCRAQARQSTQVGRPSHLPPLHPPSPPTCPARKALVCIYRPCNHWCYFWGRTLPPTSLSQELPLATGPGNLSPHWSLLCTCETHSSLSKKWNAAYAFSYFIFFREFDWKKTDISAKPG